MEVNHQLKVQHNNQVNQVDLAVAVVVDHRKDQVEQETHLLQVLLKAVMVEQEVYVIKL